MRKIEEVLRLHHDCGRSNREIAEAVRTSPTTVGDYLRRARLAGLGWPLTEGMTEAAVEAALFPALPGAQIKRPQPDWAAVHRQLGRSGVTLDLLWQEYREQHPEGYQYSGFCEHYRAFAQALPVTLRQRHAPGERLFVDYSGQTVAIVHPATGEELQAQVFVAVLGASSYTFVEATWTQGLADWIGSHVRCLEFLGGVPELLVPDNLKSGVTHACRYEPDINPSYQELAAHYGVAVLPARVRKPGRFAPRWRPGSCWPSAGFSRGYATSASSAWRRSTPPSVPWWRRSTAVPSRNSPALARASSRRSIAPPSSPCP